MLNAASPPRDPAALPRLLLTLAALLLLWPGLRLSELDIPGLFSGDNARTMGGFLAGFWPPAHDPGFLALLGRATLETLAIATAGMALAWLLAFPAALLATRALSLSALPRGGLPAWWARALRWPVRGLLILLRSVPEIVWALLFVRAVGLGPTAGVLAIAITYAGMLGKVYAEIFESVDPRPTRALLLGGGSRLAAFAYGVLPNAAGEMISYTVYRWECAIRASVVMGFVGAGGPRPADRPVAADVRRRRGCQHPADLPPAGPPRRPAEPLPAREAGMIRTWRLLLWPLLVVAAVGASFAYLDMDTAGLFSGKGLGQMAAYASEFFPPDLSAPHLRAIGRGCWKPWPCRPSAPCWRRCSACSSRCRRQVASACRRRAWRDSCSMRCARCRSWSGAR